LRIVNQSGETAQDVAKRFAQLAAVKLLESETGGGVGGGDDVTYERSDLNSHTESRDTVLLSSQQKKDAKSRAKKRLEEMEKQLVIAKSNYIQLGGRLEEISVTNVDFNNEQHTIKYNL
jgi:ankyrin repeat domain-containing protein 42